jgi:hypothetical protein
MSKIKIGDEVKVVSICGGSSCEIGDVGIVTRVTCNKHFKLPNLVIINNNPSTSMFEDRFELIPPTGFEVGKKYRYKNTQTIVEILAVDETDVWYKNIHTNIHVTVTINRFKSVYVEYIPPPPEEWRAVFYRKNGKPEISAAIYNSESECKADYTTSSAFMYAIRTDEGVLKNG